jgi:DNA (cytosine-5)-methyltransferase 1
VKAVSLFAGVGGFDLALTRNGIDVTASVEIDKHARGVLERQFPNTTHLTDICEVTGEQLFKLGFNSDGVIVGGFPCQDLSVAGKRTGLAGKRSGLFWEICRLLDETKAKWFILENVPGLLSSNGGQDLGTVIGALVERGYGIAYRILDAQYFGVPQRRRRIFIVGCLGDSGRTPAEILAIAEGRRGYSQKSNSPRKGSTSTFARGITNGDERSIAGTLAARDYKGISADDLVENKAIIFEPKSAFEENWAEAKIKNALRANASKSSHVIVFDPHRSDGVRIQGNTSNTLTSMMGTGGNNTPMVAYSVREDAKANTFSATPTDTALALGALRPSPQSHHAQIFIAEKSSVRRLTPTECERLQGFPEGWTAGQADTHRYKQMGNAVAVPVVEWIIRNMVEQIGQ